MLNIIGDQTDRSNTNNDYQPNATSQANVGSPIKFERAQLRKWINNPNGIQSPGIFHPKPETNKSKQSQLNPLSPPEVRTSKQMKSRLLKPLLEEKHNQNHAESPDKFS